MDGHIEIKKLTKKTSFQESKALYKVLWFSGGKTSINIDGKGFLCCPNLIVFIIPHKKIVISPQGPFSGWALEFSKDYFDLLGFEPILIKDASLYYSLGQIPKIVLSPLIGTRVQAMFEMIDEMNGSKIPNKQNGMFSLLKTILIYSDSACNVKLDNLRNSQETAVLLQYKDLVSLNFTKLHKVSDYAKKMQVSSKYLNQVVKNTLGVTAKQLIKEQLIIRARRDLKFTNKNVKEIAFSLGFSEPFHFSNFFKNSMGYAPTHYRGL